MIQFNKLRLSGFKSFVDNTELEIGPGLNGIVGPNGCGKSNLVEALRWVMGESSAKRMRGGGMEDVIFAGTDNRGARNFAEVSLLLDNNARKAPAAYNGMDEIEVVRKIERDRGSGYKINGKNARARDVQMLFADTVTGANSPSLVSQGHVTRMINAKPHDRRLILEESAGIAGLYARRHEAELRLKAADSNLLRVEDIYNSMESRLNSLKRQARQASKYKNLSAQIRQLEIVVTYLEWLALKEKQKDRKRDFEKAETQVADELGVVTQLTKTQNTQVAEIAPLRKEEAEIAAELQKNKIEFQRLEDEILRHKKDIEDTKEQLLEAHTDLKHEEHTALESKDLLDKIKDEHATIIDQQEQADILQAQKEQEKDTLKQKVVELEEQYSASKETAAESRAREASLLAQIQRNERQFSTLTDRRTHALNQQDALVIDEESQKQISVLQKKVIVLENRLSDLSSETDGARTLIAEKEKRIEATRSEHSAQEKSYAEFCTEISMLEQFFQNAEQDEYESVLESVSSAPGFEKALSRAMGDTLMASLDGDAPVRWEASAHKIDLPSLPAGVESLLPYITAPDALRPALSQIGYVTSDEDGHQYVADLKPGQAIVSADGTYWRWDGYHITKQATDRHSVHLEQKNKLMELEKKRAGIEGALEKSQHALNDAIKEKDDAQSAYENILSDLKETEEKLRDLRPALQKIKEKNLRIESEQNRFKDQLVSIEADIKDIKETLAHDKIAHQAIVDARASDDHNEETIQQLKITLDRMKDEYQDAVRSYDQLIQQQQTRNARLQAIADERNTTNNRAIRAKDRIEKLSARIIELDSKQKALEAAPLHAPSGKDDRVGEIIALENKRSTMAQRLSQAEEDVQHTAKALKQAEEKLTIAREERARTQAVLSSVLENLTEMENTIEEKFQMKPQDLNNHTAVDLVKYQIEDLQKLKQDRESLTRERDAIGAVNLRAEEEASELESEVTTLLHERNDLVQAIEELRIGIGKINKEARERLLVAFEHVNAHFQRLFVRLFGGGKAHLELIDSDDPLGAGLEIFAQPPGKALQSLSLLSGGEQTLASIALIFGMFLTNPSPICVLDEIDAPLDDANVDRVCDLIEEIAERGETRFLIITHHRLSMARMDRLYGVTMSEKGVSQLVSVDMQRSFDFLDQKVA